MKISRELKTGIVVLLALALFYWGFGYLKGENFLEKSRTFYAEYDNVQGLEPSATVTINGLKVGNIESIYFHPQKRGAIIVKFSVENDIKFSKNSIAQIYSPDFISGKSIKILPNYDSNNAVSGDTLSGNIEAGILGSLNDQIAPLQSKLDNFLVNANTLLEGFNTIFDKEGQTNLKQSLSKLNATLSTFKNASSSLNTMLAENGKIDSILSNANVASNNLAGLTDSLNNANLGNTIKKLETTLNNFNTILANVEKGEGSLGKLMKDDNLYKNLEGASKEMEELLREFKLNPKRFVHFSLFGKKQKKYKPEEVEN